MVAMMAIRRLGEPAALAYMRNGIKRLNAAHGLVETPIRGYHETLTRFWVWRVARCLESLESGLGDIAIADLVWQACGERQLALDWWSPALLWSPEARSHWCEPDLRPLSLP